MCTRWWRQSIPSLQYLALSVLDRIVNETLCVKTHVAPHCMDQLMGAVSSALGVHICLLIPVEEHHNSHGIIAESGVNSVTWMWSNLLPCDIEYNTPKSGWDPSKYSSSGSNHFLQLQIEGVCVDKWGWVQLRFPTTQLVSAYHSTPSNFEIKTPNKFTFSLWSPRLSIMLWAVVKIPTWR